MPYGGSIEEIKEKRNKCASKYLLDPTNKKKHLDRVKKNRDLHTIKCKDILSKFKSDGCLVCNENDDSCLDCHHIDPNVKEYTIGNMIRDGFSINKLVDELNKCVCICANCHRKFHAGKLVLNIAVNQVID